MTREEKQKAIDALKMSVPIKALTQEEFNDYIQTLNKIMNWLEQEPICETLTSGYVQEIRFPAEKVGRWIYGEDNLGTGRDGWYCNQCGHFEFWDYSSDMKSAELNLPNLCPNCGAKMQIEAEKKYKIKVITRGNCMICGKELTEGLFFCKECEDKETKNDETNY